MLCPGGKHTARIRDIKARAIESLSNVGEFHHSYRLESPTGSMHRGSMRMKDRLVGPGRRAQNPSHLAPALNSPAGQSLVGPLGNPLPPS